MNPDLTPTPAAEELAKALQRHLRWASPDRSDHGCICGWHYDPDTMPGERPYYLLHVAEQVLADPTWQVAWLRELAEDEPMLAKAFYDHGGEPHFVAGAVLSSLAAALEARGQDGGGS